MCAGKIDTDEATFQNASGARLWSQTLAVMESGSVTESTFSRFDDSGDPSVVSFTSAKVARTSSPRAETPSCQRARGSIAKSTDIESRDQCHDLASLGVKPTSPTVFKSGPMSARLSKIWSPICFPCNETVSGGRSASASAEAEMEIVPPTRAESEAGRSHAEAKRAS